MPEVTCSPALSLTALPGDGGIRTRRVAILVADGVDEASIVTVRAALVDAGATAHLIALRLGRVKTCCGGTALVATGTFETSASVLFDGVVLPDGATGTLHLGDMIEVLDFLSNQYRHGKTLLALGYSKVLLGRAGISAELPGGAHDPGIVVGAKEHTKTAVQAFIVALGRHRHPEREME